jgi:ribosomal protein S18 acetylase RimI-like enzyme
MIRVVRELAVQEAQMLLDQIVAIYQEAFSGSPYNKGKSEVASFARSLPDHVQREAFSFVAAFEPDSARMLGFAYGYASNRGQWWHENVRSALPPYLAREWLEDSYQLTEIAVRPEAQGRGIGSELHDRLLGSVSHAKAVLSTLDAETVAYYMYQARGWVTLLENYYFTGVSQPYRIMGLDLRHRPAFR